MARKKKTLPKNGLTIVREMAATGNREIDIARAMGMSFNTWQRIKESQPEALAALEEGRGQEHSALVGVLYDQAVNHGNIVAAMFLLKTRHGYKEGIAIEHTSNVRISLDVPQALSPEAYGKLINPQAALPESKDDE